MNDQCTEQLFLKDAASHKMTVLRDDGVHRHVQFKRDGTRCYQFDLITWPGYLCYCGDMGTYVFKRTEDMFEFFRTDRHQTHTKDGQTLYINPGYWGEKLEAVDKCDGYREFSLEKFRENIRDYLGSRDADKKELMVEIEEQLLNPHFENGYEAYQATYDFDHDGFQFTDFWEYSSEVYSFRFMWCCYALAWGIQQYDNATQAAETA